MFKGGEGGAFGIIVCYVKWGEKGGGVSGNIDF